MFPLTHVFMAQMIFPLADNKVILGSIFPDTNIGYDLSYDHTHRQGADLYKFPAVRSWRDYAWSRAGGLGLLWR